MRAGAFRDVVEFYAPADAATSEQDSLGQDTAPDTFVGRFPAQVDLMQGTELQRMQQRWAEARYKITLRHQNAVVFHTKMYLVWKSRTRDKSQDRQIDILNINDPGNTLRPGIVLIGRDFAG